VRKLPRVKDNKKGVVLLSGGIDSATTLYLAKKYGYQLRALIFDYNQRHKKEIECAKRIAQLTRIQYYVLRTSLPWTKSALTRRDIHVPSGGHLGKKAIPVTYVAARNIIFLSYAVSFAESSGAQDIFIGAHTQDYSGYPDCRPEFLNSFQAAANAGIKRKGLSICAPLLDKNKKEIVQLAHRLRVPLEYTWSCYRGGARPCGTCDSCRFRIRAFEQAELKDPLLN